MIRQKSLLNCLFVSVAIILATQNCTTGAEKPSIAVFDFDIAITTTGKIMIETNRASKQIEIKETYETSLLTDKLITTLTKSKKVSVVERKKMASLMQEMSLTEAELTNPKKSIKLGKLLGADYFLFGYLSMLDGEVIYKKLPYNAGRQKVIEFLAGADIRIVQTETGKIIAANSKKVKKSKKENNPSDTEDKVPVEFQHEVYDQLVDELVNSIINTLFPIKVAAFSDGVVYINRGDLKEGSKYRIMKLGEVICDPDTGEVLGQTETKLAVVEVTKGLKKLSKANVLEWLTEDESIPEGAVCRLLTPDKDELIEAEVQGNEQN